MKIAEYKSPAEVKVKSKKRIKELGKDVEVVYPYEEVKLFTLQGRWLGLGVYELIRGILENIQENWNLQRKFNELQYRGITIHHQPTDGEARVLTQEFLQSLREAERNFALRRVLNGVVK